MKKIILILLFAFIFSSSFSQEVLRFRSEFFNKKEKLADSTWVDWKGWEDSNIIITMKKDIVKIYSEPIQEYTIVSYPRKIINEDVIILQFEAISLMGEELILEIVTYKDIIHLYLRFKSFHFVYQIVKL